MKFIDLEKLEDAGPIKADLCIEIALGPESTEGGRKIRLLAAAAMGQFGTPGGIAANRPSG